jgi:uncharacterized protein YkwD
MPSAASRARLRSLAAAAVLACGATIASSAGTARAVTVPISPGALLPITGNTGAQACPDARRRPARMSHARARAALLCALNRARANHGLRGWSANRPLARAADGHAADMVRRHYFAHLDVLSRLRAAGWRGTAYGEALAWGCGPRARPSATVRDWLDSPVHRAIVLSPLYREAGIGVATHAPTGCDGGTWVLDAGR